MSDNYLVHIASDFENYYDILSFEDMDNNVDVMSSVLIADSDIEHIKAKLNIILNAEHGLSVYFKGLNK